MTKPLVSLLLIIAAFAAIVAYKDPATHDRGVVHITYWTGWKGSEFAAQKKLIDEFNRTHPKVQVRVLSVGTFEGGLNQKVQIAFATGAVPDVCSAVWSLELANYASRGVLEPLDGYMAKSGRRGEEFVPGVWKSLNYKGRPYALCATTDAHFFAFNRREFRECGLDPNHPPRTVNDLDKVVAAVTQRDANGDYIRYGFRPTWLENWAYAFGGQWYDEKTGRVTANDPRNVEALKWMASYSKKYDIKKMLAFEQTFGNDMSASGSFYTGKQAILCTGPWIGRFVERYGADLDWGLFPYPSPPGGRKSFTPVIGFIYVIPAAAEHKQAAWEFLNWMCSPHAVKEYCLSIGNIPPLKTVAAEPEFQNDRLFKFSTDLTGGTNAIGAPPVPIWADYQNEIARVEDFAVTGGRDPKKLLDDLTVRMQAELDRDRREH